MSKALENAEKARLPSLRTVKKSVLKREVKRMNQLLAKIRSENITTTNDLIYAAAVVTTENAGVKIKKGRKQDEPMWKRRIENQIKQLRKDLSRIEELKKGKKIKARFEEELQRKYWLKEKGLITVSEELKQRITAKAAKISRFKARIEQFRQNNLFKNNQGRFYDELNGTAETNIAPDKGSSIEFWSKIWSEPAEHKKDAEWLKTVKEEIEIDQQQDLVITVEKLKSVLAKIPNWKSPGPDLVQGYWLKNFTSLHERIAYQLNDCLKQGNVPSWMTRGRTILIMKDISKGNIPSNYRPITCLPMCWKLFTSMIAESIYTFLDDSKLIPEEQKGCRKGSRGTNDLLYIDQRMMKEAKQRRKNLAMAWLDYCKAYDLVPHSWLSECMHMFGIASNVEKMLTASMQGWRTELTCCNESLGQVRFRRGIFQGDSLSPLLFVIAMIPLNLILRKMKIGYQFSSNKEQINHLMFMDDIKLFAKDENGLDALIQTVRVVSTDIGMKFGLEKCAVLVMKRGKVTKSDGIRLPDDRVIKSIHEENGYRYLGILESDQVLCNEMKEKVRAEYKRRVKKVLKSKLNGGNMISAINTWAVPLIRYSAPFLEWRRDEIKEMDRTTRKIMNMYNALHPRDSVARLYLPRKEGGRGLMSVEDCVELAILGLENYIQKSNERLITSARRDLEDEELGTEKEFKAQRKEDRKSELEANALHGQHFRQTKEFSDTESWRWLREGELKKETEGLIMAAQTQSLRTNAVKAKIDKSTSDATCRVCNQAEETVDHIVSGCSKFAQKEYKRRHDCVARALHWDLCRMYDIQTAQKWYEHQPEGVVEKENVKILWDFNIQTDNEIQARRPDIVIHDKSNKSCYIIDVAIPGDARVPQKEAEKIEKYSDLRRELQKLWKVKAKVVPIVVGALGTVSKSLTGYLKEIKVSTKIQVIQKSALLGTARILRKVLEI